MKYLNKTLDHFWKRWTTEYLLELRDSHRYHGQDRTSSDDRTSQRVLEVDKSGKPQDRIKWTHKKCYCKSTHNGDTIYSALSPIETPVYPLEINCSPNADSESLNRQEGCDDDYSDDTRILDDDLDPLNQEECDDDYSDDT